MFGTATTQGPRMTRHRATGQNSTRSDSPKSKTQFSRLHHTCTLLVNVSGDLLQPSEIPQGMARPPLISSTTDRRQYHVSQSNVNQRGRSAQRPQVRQYPRCKRPPLPLPAPCHHRRLRHHQPTHQQNLAARLSLLPRHPLHLLFRLSVKYLHLRYRLKPSRCLSLFWRIAVALVT